MDAGREAELIARARRGDQPALSELFQSHHAHLVRMVTLRLAVDLQRRLDPVDVVQDAWLEVVQRFGDWRSREDVPFRVWLRLTTRQALAKAERRHLGTDKRSAKHEEQAYLSRTNVSAIGMADAFAASATSPTQRASRDELRAHVLAALESLDEIDREIVALRHFEELSNDDAAAELSIEPEAAKKRFARALVRLRPHLESLVPKSERAGS
jgi:RNA polymerase sigma-70 factor (ECF subfamily)